jgi:catechol 2,3-dioxygenase-like lactoylglutathione lyase family enzyme
MDYRIELVIMPVSDVDRARAFYGDTLGWPVDHDRTVDEHIRFVQVTPPGSACSIAFGRGLSQMRPGSLQALQVVVASAEEALADLRARGVDAQGVDDQPWGRFVSFADPDGNSWTLQELPDYAAGQTAPEYGEVPMGCLPRGGTPPGPVG